MSVCDVFDWFAPVYAGLTDLYEFNRSVLICACLRQFVPVYASLTWFAPVRPICVVCTNLYGLYQSVSV